MEAVVQPIGDRLVAQGLVAPDRLAWALDAQRLLGGHVGHHLVDAGHLSADDLRDVLEDGWYRHRRDLLVAPPAPGLLAALDIEEAVELGWIACEVDETTVLVASCVCPEEDLVAEVLDRFPGLLVEFASCRRSDIDSVALAERRRRLGGPVQAVTPAIVRPVHLRLASAGAVAAVVAATLVPVDLLAVVLVVSSAVFLAGAIAQSVSGYAALVVPRPQLGHRAAPAVPSAAPERDDDSLPLYTVIVRTGGGEAGLAELFHNFRVVDYPRERTDAILVVADSDADTLAALRSTTRRGWVRVAKVSDEDFLDVVRACDHALALARGRYVVAYDQDERPAADQLRRAVAVFEADLAARLDGEHLADPLVGLRVLRRSGPYGATPLDRLEAVEEVLPVGWSDEHGPVRSADVTSVHFNMRLLRRRGGFGLLLRPEASGPTGDAPPRIASLDSLSVRAANPTAHSWVMDRADALAQILRLSDLRRGAWRGAWRWDQAQRILPRIGAVAMFLAYPVALGSAAVTSVRSTTFDGSVAVQAGWIALGMAATVLGVVMAVVASLLAQHRGWRASLPALALPAYWLLHALAAWTALWALLVRRRAPLRSRA